MRTLKELLVILRDNVEVLPPKGNSKRPQIDGGLCSEIIKLFKKGMIDVEEYYTLSRTLNRAVREKDRKLSFTNLLNFRSYYPYLFKIGDWPSRKKWLDKQIKLLDNNYEKSKRSTNSTKG